MTILNCLSPAKADPDLHEFDIAAQQLGNALKAFSVSTRYQFIYSDTDIATIHTDGVKGQKPVDDALHTLLEGTSVRFEHTNKNTVRLFKREDSNQHNDAGGNGFIKSTTQLAQIDYSDSEPVYVAQAQPGSTSPTSARAAVNSVLEEIVVTAQKREQSIQDIGISVTAFTGKEMQELGFASVKDIVMHTPGLRALVNTGDGASVSFSLRGVGLDDFSSVNESPVAVYFDQVYQGALSGTDVLLFDTERTEVLKGPQGTLFGRNTTGGIVHFVSREPTDEFESYFEVSVGDYWLHRFEGAVSGPLSPGLKGRISAVYNDHDGYSDSRFPGVKDTGTGDAYGIRAQLLAEPTDRLKFLFKGHVADIDRTPAAFEHEATTFAPDGVTEIFLSANQVNRVCRAPGPPGADCFGYQDRDGDVHSQESNREPHIDVEKYGASLTIDWALDSFTITSITAYEYVNQLALLDSDAGSTDAVKVDDPFESDQWTQELRVAGELDRLRWTTGFYYFDRVVDAGPTVDLTGSGFITGNVTNHDEIRSWALFGQVEYDILPKWSGVVGLRYTDERREFEMVTIDEVGLFPNPVFNFSKETVGDLAIHDDNSISARVELDWRPNDDWLLYGAWSRGIKAAGFNIESGLGGPGRDPATIPYDEEVLTSYEIGSKSTLFDGRVRLNAAVFYYDYKDFQSFTFRDLVNRVTNQDAEVLGFEAELHAKPWDRWYFRFGLALLDTKVQGLSRQNFFTRQSVILDAQDMILAPDVELSGLARYDWPFWKGNMAIQGDFIYLSEHFLNINNSPALAEDNGYILGNTRLTYTSGDNRYSIALWIKNVGDVKYRTRAGSVTNFGYVLPIYNRPRWFGATLRLNF